MLWCALQQRGCFDGCKHSLRSATLSNERLHKNVWSHTKGNSALPWLGLKISRSTFSARSAARCALVPELFRHSLLRAACARPGFPDSHLPVVSSKELTSLRGQMLARSELISLRVYQPRFAVCCWHWVCLWREPGMKKVSVALKKARHDG